MVHNGIERNPSYIVFLMAKYVLTEYLPLQCLFPDAYDLPVEEVMGEREGKLKSSPEGSLSRQLATVLCIVNNDNGKMPMPFFK